MSTNTYPVLFSSTLLGAIVNTLYTVQATPDSITLQDLQLKITNTSAATRTVSIYAVPKGGSVGAATAVALNMSIAPRDYIILPIERLAAESTIQGLADVANDVNVQPIGGKLHSP